MGAMKTLGSQIRQARQQRHLSQSALARQVGCSQSALSMFEGGRTTALNAQTIGRLCSELGLLAPHAAELSDGPAGVTEGVRSFCPNPECPSNLPAVIGGETVLVPRKHLAAEHECHCGWCGEVLERACASCGAPVNAGGFCASCGGRYVTVSVPAGKKAADYVSGRAAVCERLMAWSGD